jgi:hypothetical protein
MALNISAGASAAGTSIAQTRRGLGVTVNRRDR